ncbi:tetratricopeptide repeat protein [Methylophilaceae bacterium]|jgi:tetratricopeptide (TPR) repeat protein|nr:tetratricopeptide repeat protein [Methylophilaceae bacterium]|tara:strand:- start:3172 stop:4923 length:1752 start_codon:yes stop_codon:yes gene_type:complete
MKNDINLIELLDQAVGLVKVKEFDKAMSVYEAILEKDSMNSQALSHLSIIYLMKERYIEAIDMIHKSIKILKPIIADYQNLAIAYIALRDYENAINAYENIIKISPNNSETYKLLGNAQIEVADNIGALDSYRKAYELEPDKFESIYNFGSILATSLLHEDAIRYLREAQKIDPNHIECMNKIGRSLSAIGDTESAKVIYQKLMILAPDAVGPYTDYASCLFFEGKYDVAIKKVKEVLIKKPNNDVARTNLGLFYLFNKNFKDGWKYIDSRILLKNQIDVTKRYEMLNSFFELDVNKKELKANERIIILGDAGIGDVILGLSMLKEFQKKFKNLSAEVDYRLVDLCKRSFPHIEFYAVRENRHEMLIDYDLSLFDKGIYWGSLGKYLRQKISDFPKKEIKFLTPDKEKVNEICNKLKKDKDIICGISWKSSANEGRHKTALLEDLNPIFILKKTRFLDLQYEIKKEEGRTKLEKAKLIKEKNIKIEDYEDIDKFKDIDGLTALVSKCDIIVTCSNVTAHIAGALGKKTYLFVPFQRGKLWYWHDAEGTSIWYPSIKIFTAKSNGGWGEVFERIAYTIKQDLKL